MLAHDRIADGKSNSLCLRWFVRLRELNMDSNHACVFLYSDENLWEALCIMGKRGRELN